MLRSKFVVKISRRVVLALVAALLISGFALAPQTTAYACGTIPGNACPCPGCG